MGGEISKIFVRVDDIPHTFGGFVQLLFLGPVYGKVLMWSSNMIKDGSELLLLVPALAGVVGSIVLPVLGAVPDGAIVIFSGLGPDAQTQVSVGVGALAGSTIMLLTIPWMLAILAGRVNVVDGQPQYTKPRDWPAGTKWSKLSPPGAYSGTGVRCSGAIGRSAILMLFTLIPYLLIQIPAATKHCAMEDDVKKCRTPEWAAIAGGAVATAFFIVYLVYQAMTAGTDEVKEILIDEIRKNAVRKHLVSIRGLFPDKVVDQQGEVQISADNSRFRSYLHPFFKRYDIDASGTIDANEFTLLISDLGEKPTRQQVSDMIKEVDNDSDGVVNFDEFCICMVRVINDENFVSGTVRARSTELACTDAVKRNSREEIPLSSATATVQGETRGEGEDNASEKEDEDEDEEIEVPEDLAHLTPKEQQKRIIWRAFALMGVGVSVVLLFSDPMVDVLTELGNHSGIKPFYVAFVLAPLASNASELIAAYSYALKKTEKTITISFASLIGAACMNNTFCLALFLFLIYAKNLQWVFSAETISIIVVEIIMFCFAVRRVHHWFTAFIVVSLFPLSIALVIFLENVAGLD